MLKQCDRRASTSTTPDRNRVTRSVSKSSVNIFWFGARGGLFGLGASPLEKLAGATGKPRPGFANPLKETIGWLVVPTHSLPRTSKKAPNFVPDGHRVNPRLATWVLGFSVLGLGTGEIRTWNPWIDSWAYLSPLPYGEPSLQENAFRVWSLLVGGRQNTAAPSFAFASGGFPAHQLMRLLRPLRTAHKFPCLRGIHSAKARPQRLWQQLRPRWCEQLPFGLAADILPRSLKNLGAAICLVNTGELHQPVARAACRTCV